MPRNEAKPPKQQFYTDRPDLVEQLAAMSANELAALAAKVEPSPAIGDWVDVEEDAFIADRPHLVSMLELVGSKEALVLMRERVRAKQHEGALTESQFREKLSSLDGQRESILDLLRQQGALSAVSTPSQFCLAELYLLYLNHRWTAADETLERDFRTVEGRHRLSTVAKHCRRLAQEFRNVLSVGECMMDFPMSDDLRRNVARAAGPKRGHGWLESLAAWLDEAAVRLAADRAAGGQTNKKEAAFQLAWYDLAVNRTDENDVVVWEVGRRLFRIIFACDTTDRYIQPEDYRRRVTARLNRRAAISPDAARTKSRRVR